MAAIDIHGDLQKSNWNLSTVMGGSLFGSRAWAKVQSMLHDKQGKFSIL